MTTVPIPYYFPLFHHMSQVHNLTLLDSEMDDIVRAVRALNQPQNGNAVDLPEGFYFFQKQGKQGATVVHVSKHFVEAVGMADQFLKDSPEVTGIYTRLPVVPEQET